jgi:hypothetical protein
MPTPAAHQSGAGHVDFDKLILKRKDAPSVDSAQRVNAGVLFDQEQKAGTAGLSDSGYGDLPAGKSPEVAASSLGKPPLSDNPAVPKPEATLVRPLQTYQGDIESVVGDKKVSVVSIAAAEADRRANLPPQALQAEEIAAHESKPRLLRTLVIGASVLLLVAAGGIGFYIFAKLQPVPIAQQSPAPFILVDDTQSVAITSNDGRSSIMQMLTAARDNLSLSLGLVERLQIVKPTAANDGTLQEVGAPEFLQLLTPKIPPALVRTLEPQMLLGIHSYDQNQMFMIFKTDSYETAYSGMLAWESTMQSDLSPLFTRTPAVRAGTTVTPPVVPVLATSTSTTTTSVASSTASTSATATTTSSTPAPEQFFVGDFTDQVVVNHDARVVLNKDGDILLLWTFLDRSTIVITTNDATLREVISRLSQASVISLPQAQ